jgi:hypothetical protein
MADDRKDVIKSIKYTEPKVIPDASDGAIRLEYENPGFHKFSIFNYPQPIAEISWNDSRCNLVAIDGQHRLSALKQWDKKPVSNFSDWKIPVVILTIFQVDESQTPPSLLDMVRRIFVYINSKAKSINRSRELLLNDESVNSICVQEIISLVHKNDNIDISTRKNDLLPLILFDWQGKVINHQRLVAPAALFSVEEIVSWFHEYFLGPDGSKKQKNELELLDLIPPITEYDDKTVLSYSDSIRIRGQVNKILIPGVLNFLNHFSPFKKYIKECRKLEKELTSADTSGIVQHAFFKLRFGTHNAGDEVNEKISEKFSEISDKFKKLKENSFDWLLTTDLGMRSLMYAFSKSREIYQDVKEDSISWIDFSIEYTEIMNVVYATGIFKKYNDLSKEHKGILEHLCYDGGVINSNYKVENVKDGLGTLLVLMFFTEMWKKDKISEDHLTEVWSDCSDLLQKSYQKGEKKKVRSAESDAWTGSIKAFTTHVKQKAEKNASKRIEKLESFLFD